MKYAILVVAICVLGAAGVAGVRFGYPAWLASEEPLTAPAPDFAEPAGWLIRPDNPPAPVWEEGWAIDFIVLPPIPDISAAHGVTSSSTGPARAALDEQMSGLAETLARHGAIYAPALRLPTPASPQPDWAPAQSDIERALETYLDEMNTGRAIVLVIPPGTEPVATRALARLERDTAVAERLAFLLTAPGTELVAGPLVSVAIDFAEPKVGVVRFPQATYHLAFSEETDTLAPHIADALARLEDVPRTVEPFGALEIVEPAPIERPD